MEAKPSVLIDPSGAKQGEQEAAQSANNIKWSLQEIESAGKRAGYSFGDMESALRHLGQESSVVQSQLKALPKSADLGTLGGTRDYLSMYDDGKQLAHHVVVQVAPDGRARAVTSLISKDTGSKSRKAVNHIKSQLINHASNILYLEGISEERGMLTQHRRFPADHPASLGGTPLHRLGEGNIALEVKMSTSPKRPVIRL